MKEVLISGDISFELKEQKPVESTDEKSILQNRLDSLSGKEARIRASYREGIDTLEEYKDNKALIQKERDYLERKLTELESTTPVANETPAITMLSKVQSVYDILLSDSYTYIQKNEALKQIVDKIIYDKDSDTLKIYYFLYE